MTTEELLIPRFKVIADYPGSCLGVGETLTLKLDHNFKWFIEITQESYPKKLYKEELGTYSHLFKEMGWWEERTKEEMPKYVKQINRVDSHNKQLKDIVLQVAGHFTSGDGEWRHDSLNIFCAKSYLNKESNYLFSYNYHAWLPATEEEFDKFIKQ